MDQVDKMWDEHLRSLNRSPYTISPAAREKAMALRRDHEIRRQVQYIDGMFPNERNQILILRFSL